MAEVSLARVLIILEEGIVKAKKILQGHPDTQFSAAEYRVFNVCLNNFCAPSNRNYVNARLMVFNKFKSTLVDSINMTVLPSLVNKRGVEFLRTLAVMWSNYITMGRCLCKIFECIDHFNDDPTRHPIEKIVDTHFQSMVLEHLFNVLEEAVREMVRNERAGIPIDKELLKTVFIMSHSPEYINGYIYSTLERSFLSDLSTYYTGVAPLWLTECSALDYVKKASRSLKIERERASYYLRPSTLVMLDRVFKSQVFHKYVDELTRRVEVERHSMKQAYQEILSTAGTILEPESSMTAHVLLNSLIETCANSNFWTYF